MGGNALKNTPTRRYAADEYHTLTHEVMTRLKRAKSRAWRFEVIPAYREKDSFGDMDILYSTDNDAPFDVDVVRYIFSPNEIVRNSGVISFDYKEFQIDLIHSPSHEEDYALSYFSWNDCGNLIGKLAHQLGLRHGHNGLHMPIREDNNKFGNIVLTLDHDETLQFLDLDVKKFNSGFNNLEEIFDFVAASRYYNPDLYKLENLNTIARVRDRKRDTYNRFLSFGERWRGSVAPKVTDKSVYIPVILEEFGKWKQFNQIMTDMAMLKLVKTKFNGDMVMAATGSSHKVLGEFMKFLRSQKQFSSSMIAYLPQETIIENVKIEYQNWEKHHGS